MAPKAKSLENLCKHPKWETAFPYCPTCGKPVPTSERLRIVAQRFSKDGNLDTFTAAVEAIAKHAEAEENRPKRVKKAPEAAAA